MALSPTMPKVINSVTRLMKREYGPTRCPPTSLTMARARYDVATNLYRKDLYSHFGCVNAIEFSTDGEWLVSGGDDRRVLLWNLEKAISGTGVPQSMKGEHNSNIFCLSFDSKRKRLYSAGNDEQVIVHDAMTGDNLDVILHTEAIYGLSIDPSNDNVFATACNDGSVFLWDLRETDGGNPREPIVTFRSSNPFHAVMHNPVEPRLVATANTKDGVGLWDLRNPRKCVIQYTDSLQSVQSAMSVRFNCRGTQVLGLRRRFPPILYNLTSPYPIAEFDHVSYYNSCTMKSCCFAGNDDEYVLSGSDDFRLYMWKIPDQINERELSAPEEALWVGDSHLVLNGHRSIVNQVRYNYSNSMIASSGVEKVIKLWSVFPLPNGAGDLEIKTTNRENRKVYSHEDYINLVLESGQLMTHDYSHQSVQEDPRMMAFFDSLVQRDIEGWTSSSSDESDGVTHSSWYEYCLNSRRNGASTSESSSSSDTEEATRILNRHTMSYMKKLRDRIEEKAKSYSANTVSPLVQSAASVDQAGASTSSATQEANGQPSTSNSVNGGSNGRQSRSPPDATGETNKISQLINEKKREQLRKVARLALRSTKRRLKKITKNLKQDKIDEPAAGTSTQIESSDKYTQLSSLMDRLNSSVETDARNSAEENRTRRSRYKLRRRLRYLTDQSDFILNEVFPNNDSSSDSDEDSQPDVSAEELFEAISNGFERIRNLPIANEDGEESSSDTSTDEQRADLSDSSGEQLLTTPRVPGGTSRQISEEENGDSQSGTNNDPNSTTERKRNNNVTVVPFVALYEDDDDRLGDDEGDHDDERVEVFVPASLSQEHSKQPKQAQPSTSTCTLQSGPFVQKDPEEKQTALSCLLHLSNPATNCVDCSTDSCSSPGPGPSFKTTGKGANRSYRKRKLSTEDTAPSREGAEDEASDDKRYPPSLLPCVK